MVVALQKGYKVNYDEAHNYCREGGGYIAQISTAAEDKKIMEQMKALGVMFAWIGFRRRDGDWNKAYWELNGYSVGYRGWAKDQPTKPPKDDDYVLISINSEHGWADGWHDS